MDVSAVSCIKIKGKKPISPVWKNGRGFNAFKFSQRQFPTLHIAGTNGKGSTAHAIAAVLQTAGYTVGLYFSAFKDFQAHKSKWTSDTPRKRDRFIPNNRISIGMLSFFDDGGTAFVILLNKR